MRTAAPTGTAPHTWRDLFSLPRDVHYLNCAYMSPLLRPVEEAGIAGIRKKRFPGDIGPADFFAGADRVRALFARLVGADDPARVAILPAVSYGIAIAARNTAITAGQTIVLTEGQFPSNVLVWRRLAAERGGELRVVRAPAESVGRSVAWTAAILAAIDGSTAAVALPAVHWTDGTRFDLEAIGDRARAHGAALVIDGTQSVGALPFDVAAVRPDALVCATYKWLLGPYSFALGWFGPRYDGGVPLEEAWLARAGSDDFRALVDPADEYRPAAARYDVGGRSNFILLPMAEAALEQLLAWGVETVAGHCRSLTAGLFDDLRAGGYQIDHEDGRAPHLFGLRLPPGREMEAVRGALERCRVLVSLRGTAVRVSPHLYNDAADLAALREALLGGAGA
ncbi:MAG TPA: aminotransferase class V-fold PLP-dependent enzyme [Longimicrobiales bacterium]|nr:aminotransferase class V-fold PLP-dependent enzyme [Longimicrobiales bacterium]